MPVTKEEQRINESFRLVATTALAVLATGTIFYHFQEDLKWLDALYFSVITLATVGYGDIVPHTDLGKIFKIVYVLMGIGIIATFANLLIRRAGVRRSAPHLPLRPRDHAAKAQVWRMAPRLQNRTETPADGGPADGGPPPARSATGADEGVAAT